MDGEGGKEGGEEEYPREHDAELAEPTYVPEPSAPSMSAAQMRFEAAQAANAGAAAPAAPSAPASSPAPSVQSSVPSPGDHQMVAVANSVTHPKEWRNYTNAIKKKAGGELQTAFEKDKGDLFQMFLDKKRRPDPDAGGDHKDDHSQDPE